MAKVPVFTSFDGEHDDDLRVLFIGQSKYPDSPFDIADWSVKDVSPNWEADARRRIRRSKQVAVLCGQYTDTATGVSKEIRIAREVGVPYFFLKGRKDKTCKKPAAALSTDQIYEWTWPNVKALVSGKR
jgi:Thoeris protein ThsB, TIR-like domain